MLQLSLNKQARSLATEVGIGFIALLAGFAGVVAVCSFLSLLKIGFDYALSFLVAPTCEWDVTGSGVTCDPTRNEIVAYAFDTTLWFAPATLSFLLLGTIAYKLYQKYPAA